MKLEQLYIKPARGASMVAVDRTIATAGLGLHGDCNASRSSPRQVLIVSSATLAQLRVDPVDMRSNIVVNTDVDGFPSGTVLRIGDVRIRLTLSCEPCRKLEMVRPGLARDACGRRGMLGRIIAGGEVRAGDAMSVEPIVLPGIDDSWQARVIDILGRLPDKQRVTFSRLAEIAGIQNTYCRAFPGLLRRLAGTNLPIDRVVSTSSERLEARGKVQHQEEPFWNGASYYLNSERS